MTALGALILVIVLCIVLFGSSRWALIGIMGAVLYLTQGQYVQIAGFNMYALRFVEIAGFVRVLCRHEFSFRNIQKIDKALILLVTYSTIVFVIRSSQNQITAVGGAIDALLCYFTFRGLIGGIEDYKWFLRKFLLLLVPYVGLLLFERITYHNLFAAMGGIEYGGWVRDGKLRCQGSFRQASLLGTLGASFLPMYVSLWLSKNLRKFATLGIILCLTIVWASNSGGPAMSTAVAITGWSLWKLRMKMHLVRRGIVLSIAVIALVMNAPIWYLLARLGSITGGSGWHRAHLMDMAFQNLDRWWLWGMRIQDTTDWFPYVLSITGGADITNQYLGYGVDAGLAAMILFMVLLIMSFNHIGRALKAIRTQRAVTANHEALVWGLGVMLAIHCLNWLSITYFDQTIVVWYLQLAVIANVTGDCLKSTQSRLETVTKKNPQDFPAFC